MITTEEVEVISSDEKVKETKTQVTYDYSDYVSDMYPISYYKDYIKNSNKFYKDINGVKASLKVKTPVSFGIFPLLLCLAAS